jgi:hypothetical protein
MATFGQGINPQLGAIDYSPILRGSMAGAQMAAQGSQMIGQGLANLGQEVGKGVEAYYKKKEENKLVDDGITAIQNLNTSNPEILKNLGVKDANDRGVIKSMMKAMGGPAQAIQMANAIGAMVNEQKATELAGLYGMSGTTEISPDNGVQYTDTQRRLARNQYMGEQIQSAQLANVQAETEKRLADAKKAGTPMQAKPPLGYEYNATGGLEPIKGGPADITTEGTPAQINAAAAARDAVTQDLLIAKQEAATRLQNKKFLGAAEARKTELETTLDFVNKARALSRKNVGGPIGGRIGMLGKENQKLAGYLDTIKSNLRLNKMSELKALSPSGSTGFGQQSDREGAVMEQYLGTLSQYQPEELTQENLDVIETYINKQLRSYNPKEALIAPVSDEAIFQEFGL